MIKKKNIKYAKIVCLSFMFFLFFICSASSSEIIPQYRNDHFVVAIRDCEILGQSVYTGLVEKNVHDYIGQQDILPILRLNIDFINESKNIKHDLSKPLAFSLTDEFGNHYQQLEAPVGYKEPLQIPNVHYPSLYPSESYNQTIFFEVPIEKSNQFILMVDASLQGIDEKFLIPFDREKIIDFLAPKRQPVDSDLEILHPSSGLMVEPGQVVDLRVRLATEIAQPQSICIVAPNYFFEDTGIAKSYRIKIPDDQAPGNFDVVVMAKWIEDNLQDNYISQIVSLTVKNKEKECLENCQKTIYP